MRLSLPELSRAGAGTTHFLKHLADTRKGAYRPHIGDPRLKRLTICFLNTFFHSEKQPDRESDLGRSFALFPVKQEEGN